MLVVPCRTEALNWRRRDGKAKIGGVVVCVTGAFLMAVYRGPAVFGDGFSDLNMQGAVGGKPSPEPVGWLAATLFDMGVDMWHVGVVCLIGNCFCMAMYLAVQVMSALSTQNRSTCNFYASKFCSSSKLIGLASPI